MQVAIQLELTAYDFPYVELAMKHNLTLVTEDEGLREKAKVSQSCKLR